jgi:acetolactate synthase-1/2/3 large subunit
MSTRGADLLVQALRQAGVRVVFALSGNHVMAVFDALLGSGIRLVHTRHEAAAVHMADAWARLTGEPGIALVTGGPGHANALSALFTARLSESPVVLLSGHAPTHQLGLGAFQEMAQAEMAAPVCKASWTCATADAIGTDLARALRTARGGRPGPVHLSLPADLLEGPCSETPPPRPDFEPAVQALHPSQAAGLLAWLRAARRPLVLAGPAASPRAQRLRAQALQAASGVPVLVMESPRGMADPALGALPQVLARADAILLLGKRLDFTLGFGRAPALPATTRWAQVDAEAGEFERTRHAVGPRLEQQAQADLPQALEALIAAARPSPAQADWAAEVAQAVAWRADASPPPAAHAAATGLHPLQALQPLQPLLDSHPDAVLVADGGEFGQWAQSALRAPQRLVNGVAGAIGSSLPFALAARCALPPEVPVVAVMGDGTVGFHLAEFETASREGLPVLVVVGNDGRWNAEYQIQLRAYGEQRLIGCELEPARYDLAAAALGGHGEHIGQPSDWSAALERSRASGRAALLNVIIEGVAAPQPLRTPPP